MRRMGHWVTDARDCWQMRRMQHTLQCNLSLDRHRTSSASSSVELPSHWLVLPPVQMVVAVILKVQYKRGDLLTYPNKTCCVQKRDVQISKLFRVLTGPPTHSVGGLCRHLSNIPRRACRRLTRAGQAMMSCRLQSNYSSTTAWRASSITCRYGDPLTLALNFQ